MHRLSFQAAANHFKKAAVFAQRARFSSQTRSSSFVSQRRFYTGTLSAAVLATGITYTAMATQHDHALLEQKHALNGTADADYAAAKTEQDNLPPVLAARENPDYFEIDAYGFMKPAAKLHSLTASVSAVMHA